MEVINAAMPYVDVLSLQDFRDPVKHLTEWHEKTGKPVLLADSAKLKRSTNPGDQFLVNQGQGYAERLEGFFQNPGCIGFHLRGANQRNRARRWGLLHSAITGRLVLSRMARARDAWSGAQARYVASTVDRERGARNRPFGVAPEKAGALAESVACWRESSLAIHNLCTPLGIRYLHLLQPTLHDEGSKPVSERERLKGIGERGFDRRVTEGYELLRAGCASLVARGVATHDLSYAFEGVTETLYYDECHFNQAGNLVLAERVLELIEGVL